MQENNRIGLKDVLAKDKLEASSFLLYKKEYRQLSNDAKLLYQYLLKRFSVTEMKYEEAIETNNLEEFTFIDEKGKLFCFASNDELMFVLNVSEPTIVKCKKELNSVNLLEEVKQSIHKTNRLYLYKVVMDLEDKKEFQDELKKFKTLQSEKRKTKNKKRESSGKASKKVVARRNPDELKKFKFKNKSTELKKIKFSELKKIKFMNLKNLSHSTKEVFSTKESLSTKESFLEEEEINRYTLHFLQNDLGYSSSIVEDIIKHMKINDLTTFTKEQMIEQNKRIIKWVTKTKEPITDFGYFFVNGILKFEPTMKIIRQNKMNTSKQSLSSIENLNPQNRDAVPFYNWLEN